MESPLADSRWFTPFGLSSAGGPILSLKCLGSVNSFNFPRSSPVNQLLLTFPLQVDLSSASNVLDRWILAATRSLTAYVRKEMGAYRLYTVVPRLVAFIESLTNVYVRYNRGRLKGQGNSTEDCTLALGTLFDVLLTLCKVGVL